MGIVTSRQATEEFIRGDPFVLHGVVCSWRVRPWDQSPTGPDDRTVSGMAVSAERPQLPADPAEDLA